MEIHLASQALAAAPLPSSIPKPFGMPQSYLARVICAALLTISSLAACATNPATDTRTAPEPASAAEAEQAAAIARARADSARHPYTAADIHFMTAMIDHHAQALRIARWAPTHGASPAVQTLAERIINGQRDEIRTMQQWLRDRGLPVPQPDLGEHAAGAHTMQHDSAHHAAHHPAGRDSAPMHAHGAGGNHATMPGMLTEEQLAQLDAARGREFDRLFLTLMIQHHKGAVEMARELFSTYGAAQDETVFKFASDVHVDQVTEIERMERMLVPLLFESDQP